MFDICVPPHTQYVHKTRRNGDEEACKREDGMALAVASLASRSYRTTILMYPAIPEPN